jgi:hypothetical protein
VIPVEDLLAELEAALPASAGDPSDGVVVGIEDVHLKIPVEAQLHEGATLHASLPRGRYATGFSVEHGRIAVTFVRGEE